MAGIGHQDNINNNTTTVDGSKGWTIDTENLLASWCEKSGGFRWLHDRSRNVFATRSNMLTIPNILLSTFAGAAGFSAVGETTPIFWMPLMIAIMNTTSACLSALQSYTKYPQYMERHHRASIAYLMFYRRISVELSLPREDRQDAMILLRDARNELDRLIEESPEIPVQVINEYRKHFTDTAVAQPDITNGHKKVKVNSNSRSVHTKLDADIFIKMKAYYALKQNADMQNNEVAAERRRNSVTAPMVFMSPPPQVMLPISPQDTDSGGDEEEFV